MKPYHTHDCDGCTYLGSFTTPAGVPHDAYICISKTRLDSSSCILRYSSEGPEYHSLPWEIVKVLDTARAFRMDGTRRWRWIIFQALLKSQPRFVDM